MKTEDYKILRMILVKDPLNGEMVLADEIEFNGFEGTRFVIFDKESVKVKNRFWPEKICILTPIQVAVYDMVIGFEMIMTFNPFDEFAKEKYRISKDIFRRWSDEYNMLLD
jgi:hypothetical protein